MAELLTSKRSPDLAPRGSFRGLLSLYVSCSACMVPSGVPPGRSLDLVVAGVLLGSPSGWCPSRVFPFSPCGIRSPFRIVLSFLLDVVPGRSWGRQDSWMSSFRDLVAVLACSANAGPPKFRLPSPCSQRRHHTEVFSGRQDGWTSLSGTLPLFRCSVRPGSGFHALCTVEKNVDALPPSDKEVFSCIWEPSTTFVLHMSSARRDRVVRRLL